MQRIIDGMLCFVPLLVIPGFGWFPTNCLVGASSPKTIIIDWIIPLEEEEDVYDGIKAHVGDTMKFQWSQDYHNIYIHPSGDCSADDAILVGSSSINGDESYTFTEDDIGKVSFACDVGSHCENGQFVTIIVEHDDENSVPSGTPTYSSPPSHNPTTFSGPPGANTLCDGQVRKRRDWDLISITEKELFKDAIEEAIDHGYYQVFLRYHSDLMSSIQSHQTCAFIHWHRRYLLALENMLRSLDSRFACLTIPYWNIMEHYKDQRNDLCESFGNCARVVADLGGIPTGVGTRVYANIEATGSLFIGAPLTRLFDDNGEKGIVRSDLLYVRIPDSCDYDAVLKIFKESESLVEFARNIQKGIHDDVHDHIGGFMPTYSSPTDPLFLVWHSFIDLLLYMWEVCNLGKMEETFNPFESCIYTTSEAADLFPDLNAADDIWMKWDNTSIVDDPVIGKYFQDIGLKFQEVSLVNQLGENEFTYDHLTPEILQFLQDPNVCPEGQWYTASPTATPLTLSPTAEADQDLFNKWIKDVRAELVQIHSGNMQKVNAFMQFLLCTLGGSKQIPSDEFRQDLYDGTLRDPGCNFFLPRDDNGESSPAPSHDGTNSYRPKTIIIDWFIPTEEEEDVYDGIKANVGDTVKFQWSQDYHNIYIHPSGDCSEDGAILVGSSRIDGDESYTFTEDDIGKVSFACDVGSHCENGQFVTITVKGVGDGSPTSSPQAPSPSNTPSISALTSHASKSYCNWGSAFLLPILSSLQYCL